MKMVSVLKILQFQFLMLERCLCSTDRCKQPKLTGRCRAYFVRYYYNYEEKQCQKFVFGGCGGNRNNFGDRTSCEFHCNFRTFRGRTYGDGKNAQLTLTTSTKICDRIFLPFSGLTNPCKI